MTDYLTLVFRADELEAEERLALCRRGAAMSWSHALQERDRHEALAMDRYLLGVRTTTEMKEALRKVEDEHEALVTQRDEATQIALEAQVAASEAMDERDAVQRLADCRARQRDELAAHVERYHAAYVKLTNSEPTEDADTRETMYLATQSLMAEFDAIAESQPTTSLYQRKAQWQAEALRAFAEQQRAALENIPARDRYALHPGTSVDGWHHTFAQRADAAADEIDGQVEGGDT